MGIFECRLDEATFVDPVRIDGTRRHRVKLLLKISCKNAEGVPARITGMTVKVPPDNGLLRSDEYDPCTISITGPVEGSSIVDVAAEYRIETEDLDGDQLDRLHRGLAIDFLCSAGAIIILDYIQLDEGPTSSRFSVASSKGTLRRVLQEIP